MLSITVHSDFLSHKKIASWHSFQSNAKLQPLNAFLTTHSPLPLQLQLININAIFYQMIKIVQNLFISLLMPFLSYSNQLTIFPLFYHNKTNITS